MQLLQQRFSVFSGMLVFAAGVLLSFVLIMFPAWADFEAAFYGFPRLGDGELSGYTCPLFITPGEVAGVSVTIHNPVERVWRPMAWATISNPGPFRKFRETLEFAPGESKTLSWQVQSDDAVMGFFVFAKAYLLSAYPTPNSEAVCGIILVNLPGIHGMVVYWLGFGLAVALTCFGLWASEPRSESLAGRASLGQSLGQARKFIAILCFVGLYSSYVGNWPLSGLVMIFILLTVLGMTFITATHS